MRTFNRSRAISGRPTIMPPNLRLLRNSSGKGLRGEKKTELGGFALQKMDFTLTIRLLVLSSAEGLVLHLVL